MTSNTSGMTCFDNVEIGRSVGCREEEERYDEIREHYEGFNTRIVIKEHFYNKDQIVIKQLRTISKKNPTQPQRSLYSTPFSLTSLSIFTIWSLFIFSGDMAQWA